MTFVLFISQIVLIVCDLAGAISLEWFKLLIPLWIFLAYKIPILLLTWAANNQDKYPTDQ